MMNNNRSAALERPVKDYWGLKSSFTELPEQEKSCLQDWSLLYEHSKLTHAKSKHLLNQSLWGREEQTAFWVQSNEGVCFKESVKTIYFGQTGLSKLHGRNGILIKSIT